MTTISWIYSLCVPTDINNVKGASLLRVSAMVYGELFQKLLKCLVFILGHDAFDEFHNNALEYMTVC